VQLWPERKERGGDCRRDRCGFRLNGVSAAVSLRFPSEARCQTPFTYCCR
jgi:hypothetical protein